jgi:hypothetical protein
MHNSTSTWIFVKNACTVQLLLNHAEKLGMSTKRDEKNMHKYKQLQALLNKKILDEKIQAVAAAIRTSLFMDRYK